MGARSDGSFGFNGYGGSNGKLNPTDTTTRAEIAQVLYNLLGK